MRRTRLRANGTHHVVDHRRRGAPDLQCLCVKWNREQPRSKRVNKVTRRHVPGVTTRQIQKVTFPGFQRLHYDLGFVPRIADACVSQREQQVATARKDLRAISELARFQSDPRLWHCAAVGGSVEDSLSLSEVDLVI